MKKYYLFENGAQQGPYSLEDLQAKRISASTSVWFHPMPEWKPAGEIEELRPLFSSQPAAGTTVSTVQKEENWSNVLFYYADGTGQQGPLKLEQLKSRNLHYSTPVWYEKLTEWTVAEKIPVIKDMIDHPSAEPAPVVATTTTSQPAKKSSGRSVRFSLRKDKESQAALNKEVDLYFLSATFIFSDKEDQAYNDHPLVRDMIFIEYIDDTPKQVLVSSLYLNPEIVFKAYSVDRLLMFKDLAVQAAENFVRKINGLADLEKSIEVSLSKN